MSDVLFYHVVGDITIGKPIMKQFPHSASVRDALEALKLSNHVELAVWKMSRRYTVGEDGLEDLEQIQNRFVGILSFMDIMTFLSSPQSLQNLEWALESPISEIVSLNPGLIQLVDPATSLYDTLQIVQKGVRILLVPLNSSRQKLSTHFSVIYHGRWIVPPPAEPSALLLKQQQDHCCLTVEDVVRFLTGCLGALAPIPLTPVESLGIINKDFLTLDLDAQAVEATRLFRQSCTRGRSTVAVAVVKEIDTGEDAAVTGRGFRLFGEISSFSFAGCDENMIFAFATMAAAEFIFYCNYYLATSIACAPRPSLPPEERARHPLNSEASDAGKKRLNTKTSQTPSGFPFPGQLPEVPVVPSTGTIYPPVWKTDGIFESKEQAPASSSTQSVDLTRGGRLGSPELRRSVTRTRSIDRSQGNSKLVTCRPWNSLAAVLAQMLANGATHVWVTKEDGAMVGVVTYVEIVAALCKKRTTRVTSI